MFRIRPYSNGSKVMRTKGHFPIFLASILLFSLATTAINIREIQRITNVPPQRNQISIRSDMLVVDTQVVYKPSMDKCSQVPVSLYQTERIEDQQDLSILTDPSIVSAPSVKISYKLIASGFEKPLDITHAGDGSGRLFIGLQGGKIMIYDGNQNLPIPFLDISSLVSAEGEQGLLGVAFHPEYENNGYFFVDYTDLDGNTIVARYRVSTDNPDRADPSTAVVLISESQPGTNHNGGQLQFGPDGYLYISLGDGGPTPAAAQDKGSLLGKILRIDVDGGAPYEIPPDNPFIDDANARDQIWAMGFRNPWRFSFDRFTGDLLIGDVGQNAWEEINFQSSSSEGGENYGWPLMEGNHCYDPPSECNDGSLTLPILEYPHFAEGCSSVTGGYIYRGSKIPALRDLYIYGEFCQGIIWVANHSEGGSWTSTQLLDTNFFISTFGEDEEGELYFSSYFDGAVFQIIPGQPVSVADFDGDGTTDPSVYTIEQWGGTWYVKDQFTEIWGNGDSIPIPRDYDGDGDVDVAVFHDGIWYIADQFTVYWGDDSSVPVPGDYDGDGILDIAVFNIEPWGGTWYIRNQATVVWGGVDSIPVPADYNGDGRTDIAVYDNGVWYVKDLFTDYWGDSSSIPLPGDYNGDRIADLAVFKVEIWGGAWYIKDQNTVVWGGQYSIPVAGDYDGDGVTDVAVFDHGMWYVKDLFTVMWGDTEDYPLPAPDHDGDGQPY